MSTYDNCPPVSCQRQIDMGSAGYCPRVPVRFWLTTSRMVSITQGVAQPNMTEPVAKPSKASEQLRKRLAERGAKDSAARELGVSPAALSRWIHGFRKPNASWRDKLRRRYRIGWADWEVAA